MKKEITFLLVLLIYNIYKKTKTRRWKTLSFIFINVRISSEYFPIFCGDLYQLTWNLKDVGISIKRYSCQHNVIVYVMHISIYGFQIRDKMTTHYAFFPLSRYLFILASYNKRAHTGKEAQRRWCYATV